MSGQYYEQQQQGEGGRRNGVRRNTGDPHDGMRGNNRGGVRRDAHAGAGPRSPDGDEDDDGGGVVVEGGGEPSGGWVEGPGWRMKAPAEGKRQQVVRGLQAAERIERQRQERKARTGRAYTTPRQGRAVAPTGAAPLSERELRRTRVLSDRARKFERMQAREEMERSRKAEEDAAIQKKKDRARRAQEKLDERQKRENAQCQQDVRFFWQRQSFGTSREDPSGVDITRTGDCFTAGNKTDGDQEDLDVVESHEKALAIRNSLAEVGSGGGGGAILPAPAPRGVPPARGIETPHRRGNPAELHRVSTDDGGASGRETTQVWDRILDGPVPAGLTGGVDAYGGGAETGGDDFDADLTEALSVVEWDVSEEISSEADREGFRRNLLRLLRGVLGGEAWRREVRSGNQTFHANIGRWACGRRLMRLAGFFMKRDETTSVGAAAGAGDIANRHAGYVWVYRPHRASGHVNMLHGLVGALEEQEIQAATLDSARGGGGGAGLPAPPSASQDLSQQASTNYALASGVRLFSPTSRLYPATKPGDAFSQVRQEQDEEFEEALRRDQAALAAKKVRPSPAAVGETDTHEHEAETPADVGPDSAEDVSGRSLRDTGVEPGDGSIIVASSPEETPEERRAKIAQSFAHLKLGS